MRFGLQPLKGFPNPLWGEEAHLFCRQGGAANGSVIKWHGQADHQMPDMFFQLHAKKCHGIRIFGEVSDQKFKDNVGLAVLHFIG